MRSSRTYLPGLAVLVLTASGCSTMQPTEVDSLRTELASERAKRTELERSVDSLQERVRTQSASIQQKDARLADADGELQRARQPSTVGGLLPPNAKRGECYARVFIPPSYTTVTRKLEHREAAERISVTAPRYEWQEQRVLVKEASTRLETLPAKYEWREERVLVKEATEQLVAEPAVYRDVQEQVLVRPAYTTWKKGRGPIERIDEATGEIMCLVEVPAEYRTLVKHVVVKPASTRKVAIPAEYKTVRKQVLVEPARTRSVEVPAEYSTVRVRKLVEPPRELREPLAATEQTIQETRLAAEGRMEWRSILCETNTTADVVRRLQTALAGAGYEPGPIDGIAGPRTLSALSSYQDANGLARGRLTLESLRKLGVM